MAVFALGSLVRVLTPGTPHSTTHLVTSLLLRENGLHYGLDGGASNIHHIFVEGVADPTPLLLSKALRLAPQPVFRERADRDRV